MPASRLTNNSRTTRVFLPNGCSYSRFVIIPTNWNTPRANVDLKWSLMYRFYNRENQCKQYNICRDVNQTCSLSEKQDRMRTLIRSVEKELHAVVAHSIERNISVSRKRVDPDYLIPETRQIILDTDTFKNAVLKALYSAPGIISYKRYMQTNCIEILKVAKELSLDELPVSQISKRHMTWIFERMEETQIMSANLYNRRRFHMMQCFDIISKHEANEKLPMAAVSKKVVNQEPRRVISLDELSKVLIHLKRKDYYFYRFSYIFFHSGVRPIELCRMKREDILLDNKMFYVTSVKGGKIKKSLKPMHDKVYHLWVELYTETLADAYPFSKDFKPGPQPHLTRKYSHYYQRLVKKELDIQADFYTFKHRKLNEIQMFMQSNPGYELAQKITQQAASHESFETTKSHYLVDQTFIMNQILTRINSII